MPTFKTMMYFFSLAPRHLKFHYNQRDCKWVDANTIMSNMTMGYDPVRKFYSLDLIDAKSLDKFMGNSKL